jgi:hypothetical protein
MQEIEITLSKAETELLGTDKTKAEATLAMLAEVALADIPAQILKPDQVTNQSANRNGKDTDRES